jgi:hypothetical protein
VAAAVRIGDYQAPLSGDATQFLYVGETVAHGGMPYADAAFNKGPLTALLFALIEPIVGTSPTAVRLTVVPFAAATALALAGYVAHHAGRHAGALAGLAFAAFSALPRIEGANVKSEHYGVAPVFGALWLATRRGTAGAVGAGALVSCAILINPALEIAIPAVAFELWLGTARGDRARRLMWLAAGALAPVAVAFAWLAAGGAVDDMLRQVGGQISNSLPGHPLALIALVPISLGLPAGGLWALGVIGCAVGARDPRLRLAVLAMALVLGAVLLRVKLATYELDYQYYPALPAIFGAVALGVAAIWPSRPLGRLATAGLVLALPFGILVFHPELTLLDEKPDARSPYGAAAYPVAAFVRTHTRQADRIIVAGGRAEVYWLAERRAPTRFFDTFEVHGDRRYAAERQRDLVRHPPAAIVIMQTERLEFEPGLRRLVRSLRYREAYGRAGSYVWLRPGRG